MKKKVYIKDFFEDIGSVIIIIFRLLLVMLVVGLGAGIPLLFFIMKIIALITSSMSNVVSTIIGFIIFIGIFIWISYLFRNGNPVISTWIMTGHIQIEISDEKNRQLRAAWLKLHRGKERTRTKKWNINLTSPLDFFMLNPVYPVDKYGREEIARPPLCYRVIIPVTHNFFGDLPVKGDIIKFTWNLTSNNDIKNLYVRAVEIQDGDNSDSDKLPKWTELDEKGSDGTLCVQNLVTGKKTKISGELKLSGKVNDKIQLCFWYMPDDAEGESVFKLKF